MNIFFYLLHIDICVHNLNVEVLKNREAVMIWLSTSMKEKEGEKKL